MLEKGVLPNGLLVLSSIILFFPLAISPLPSYLSVFSLLCTRVNRGFLKQHRLRVYE